MNTAIRTVLFDFDGTLVFYRPDSMEVIGAFCAEIGQPLGPEAERHGRRARHAYFARPETGPLTRQLSPEAFWYDFNRYLLAALGVEGDAGDLAARLAARFDGVEPDYYCPEPAPRVLAELRARGYRLGLITNRDRVERLHEILAQLRLGAAFDSVLVSGEIGIRKPDPGIFHAALQRAGARAGESLYVGDNYWTDVLGAQAAGLTPALLDPQGLFPEADCLVLQRLDDLLSLLP